METPDTFTLLPISIDSSTKTLSSPHASLDSHLSAVNTIHRQLVSLGTPNGAPPPPLPVNPQRSQNLGKLRDNALAALKKRPSNAGTSSTGVPQNASEALKLWNVVVDAALSRPGFEPSGLFREEAAMAFSGRAEAYLSARMWADALVDVKLSLECKRAGNPRAWARGARALMEMGKRAEAAEFAKGGLEGEEAALAQAKAQFDQIRSQLAQAQAAGQMIPPPAIAQAKQVEQAVMGQEDAMRDLRDFVKQEAS